MQRAWGAAQAGVAGALYRAAWVGVATTQRHLAPPSRRALQLIGGRARARGCAQYGRRWRAVG